MQHSSGSARQPRHAPTNRFVISPGLAPRIFLRVLLLSFDRFRQSLLLNSVALHSWRGHCPEIRTQQRNSVVPHSNNLVCSRSSLRTKTPAGIKPRPVTRSPDQSSRETEPLVTPVVVVPRQPIIIPVTILTPFLTPFTLLVFLPLQTTPDILPLRPFGHYFHFPFIPFPVSFDLSFFYIPLPLYSLPFLLYIPLPFHPFFPFSAPMSRSVSAWPWWSFQVSACDITVNNLKHSAAHAAAMDQQPSAVAA